MDREVPSHYFNMKLVFFYFLQFHWMYFLVKCSSKNFCPPAPFNASGIPNRVRKRLLERFDITHHKVGSLRHRLWVDYKWVD